MRRSATVLGLSVSKLIVVAWLLMLVSGLCVVFVSHQTRLLYGELALLEQDRNGLEVAWGRYLLEESALASHHRVETYARKKLDMQVPELDQIVVVRP